MINYYAIFDNATGRCVQICTADSQENANSACSPGSIAVLVEADFKQDKHYLHNEVVTPIPDRPSENDVFNYTTKQWEDPRTLQDIKDAQWNQIKQARTQAEYGGFEWDGSRFDSDATSQNRITGAVQLAQIVPSFTIDWTLEDNTVRTLGATDMVAVGAAMGVHVQTQFAKAQALRVQIDAATTKEAVEAVVW